ncbi:DUF397 domain-containing protein [Actinocorallia libanotica]|uniref:DUF397 domain-containing protein n=1 Tax=Actinocorallia libanotica TaxID=46162 RepID=UPI0031CEEE70
MISWRKSTYSDTDGLGSCVEVAPTDHTILIRDSKNRDTRLLSCTPPTSTCS